MTSRNQKSAAQQLGWSAGKFCGWDWGQHGDAAYFVLGMYRRFDGQPKTFYVSTVTGGGGMTYKPPSEYEVLRDDFLKFAEGVLPRKSHFYPSYVIVNQACRAIAIDSNSSGLAFEPLLRPSQPPSPSA